MTKIEQKRIEECLRYLADCIQDGEICDVHVWVNHILAGGCDDDLEENEVLP